MSIATGNYLYLASMDAALPSGSGNTVAALDDYARQTRGCLKGLYDATHTAVDLTHTTTGDVDLQTIDATSNTQPGRINVSGNGTITNFTNGIDGQMLILIGASGTTLSLDANANLVLSTDHTFAQYYTVVLTLVGTVWHELASSANTV